MNIAKTKRLIVKILALAIWVTTCPLFSACAQKPDTGPKNLLPFLTTEGNKVVNADGEEVTLRGVNAGGLCVIEQWMTGFSSSTSPESQVKCIDHKTTTLVFAERFGKEAAAKLWRTYMYNWWSGIDFKNCAEMGMNVIRLPFSYMTVDFDAVFDYADAGNYDFSYLDEFVEEAAEYGLYTILDLHGAYGSQNGQDHSGESKAASDVDFYSNGDMQELTVDLWRALAEHYKDNSAVAGYDILNEPAEKTASGGTSVTEERHFAVYDKIYDAIREVDNDHIVIFESCWDGRNLPQPSMYGWENCMYSFHHYTSCTGEGLYEEHCESFSAKLAEVAARNFNVPLYMGEFTCYDNEAQWDYTLQLLNDSGWHWTSWTYKTDNKYSNSGWGIVCLQADSASKVNAHYDSYETIMQKFGDLVTTKYSPLCTFSSGRTLFDIMKEYCSSQK